MFGLNDNNQTGDLGQASADPVGAPMPAMPAEPFGDKAAPAGPPAPQLPLQEPPPAIHSDHPTHQEPVSEDMLIGLKEEALGSLTPLVSHLNQTPEEHFKTMMMLIQASDNSSLIKDAYAAANQIPDEKARAQALLDVINEINYFTQKDEKDKV